MSSLSASKQGYYIIGSLSSSDLIVIPSNDHPIYKGPMNLNFV